jgi:hypothetical protein
MGTGSSAGFIAGYLDRLHTLQASCRAWFAALGNIVADLAGVLIWDDPGRAAPVHLQTYGNEAP